MPTARATAILRDGVWSPNHIANDAAILHAAAQELRKRGMQVDVCGEKEFCDGGCGADADIILSMGRNAATLAKLQCLEEEGRLVVNSGASVENCVRMVSFQLFRDAGIPVPESFLVDTNVEVCRRLNKSGFGRCWVKRADSHVLHLEDIARCRHPEEAQEILHEFFLRGIRRAVVSRFVEGDVLKFYGVASVGWFHWFMPMYPAGSERSHPLMSEGFIAGVQDICWRAASALGVDVFGGEMIVTPDGECLVTEFDDWPSFAPCRKDAARAIARSISRRVKFSNHNRRRS